MARAKGLYNKVAHEPIHKGTSIGRRPNKSTMKKNKKRNFKKYRGQGR